MKNYIISHERRVCLEKTGFYLIVLATYSLINDFTSNGRSDFCSDYSDLKFVILA